MTFKHTVNLGNSIIGVSILTMPYCFEKCGIILGLLLIFASSILNRVGCHFLLRSAIISRKKNVSHISYLIFGSTGKLVIELCTFGYLIGTCVAFFVVIGGLGSSLVSSILSISNGPHLRTFIMTLLGMFVVLPLGLLRRTESLASFSALSLSLYVFLAGRLFFDALYKILDSEDGLDWSQINLWDSSSILITLPIFAMALSPQTQLFEIFESALVISDDYTSIQKMNNSIKSAITIGSFFYIAVGIFGYIGFIDKPLKGNILLLLPTTFASLFTQLCFVLTVLVSLPLCLFPCRTSLHSLLFRKASLVGENSPNATSLIYISDSHFRFLTVIIIVITIGISVIISQIELVLGITGSTMGTLICFIMPGVLFINLTFINNSERMAAQCLTFIGIFILFSCTYSTLQDANYNFKSNLIKETLKGYAPNLNEKFLPQINLMSPFTLSSSSPSSSPSPLPLSAKSASSLSSSSGPLSKPQLSLPVIKDLNKNRSNLHLNKKTDLNKTKSNVINMLHQAESKNHLLQKAQSDYQNLLNRQKEILKEIHNLDEKKRSDATLDSDQPSYNKLAHLGSPQKANDLKKLSHQKMTLEKPETKQSKVLSQT